MNAHRSVCCIIGCTAFLWSSVSHGHGLRVGRAAVDITPAAGTPMLTPQRPPFEVKLAGEAHDPIQVKAIVLEQQGVKAAMIACDLTSLPLRMSQEARRLIGETTGVDPGAVILNSTHSHTAPQIRLKYLGKADQTARQKAGEYVAGLPSLIAEAVKLAEADLQAATAYAAIGREESVSFNRRFYLRDGTVMANPFKGEDEKLREILRPAGPTDPDVGVVAFKNAAGEPLAAMVNFSIHLDTMGGDQPSADLADTVERLLQSVHGEQMLVFWGSGASGNVNHYDLTDPQRFRREKGPHESARIGTIVAAEALRAFGKLEPLRDAPLRVARETVRVDYHPEKTAALRGRMKGSTRYFDGEVDVLLEDNRLVFEAEVAVVALGNELAWVGLPGEMFVELGLNLKNASPFRYTMIHSLANGAIGYVPNLKAYPEGSREVQATRCAPGSGERLVEAATRMLAEAKTATAPQTVDAP
jgi:neutral ceramidase